MEHNGLISKDTLAAMKETSANNPNCFYGITLIKSGAAVNKYAAAAMVFARLVVASQNNPQGAVRWEDWQSATRYAMVNAGAKQTESYLATAELIQFQRDQSDMPLTQFLAR